MLKYKSAQEIYDLLSEGVFEQHQAKRVIASSLARHLVCSDPNYKGEYQKANILIIGKSGTGKTELMRQLKRTQQQWSGGITLPIISFDVSKLAGTSWKGTSIDDVLIQLHHANRDKFLNVTERGIIHLDEIDKLITADTGEYGTGALHALLTIIEGSTLPIDSSRSRDIDIKFHDSEGRLNDSILKSIDTTNILFILSGVFENFEKSFQNKTLGFNKDDEKEEDVIYNHEELMKRVHIPAELMGRISQITTTHHIPEEHLVEVLNKICTQKYKPFLDLYNIKYKSVFTKSFLNDIVENSYSSDMGMRLCYAKIDEHLGDLLFDKTANHEALAIEGALTKVKEKMND